MGEEAPNVGNAVFIRGVRIAFAEGLREATQYEGKGDFRYSCTFLIEKGSANDKLVREELMKAALKVWKTPEKAKLNFDNLFGRTQSSCYYDGNLKSYDGFAGKMALAAIRPAKNGPPVIKDRDGKTDLPAESGLPYSGAVVNGKLEFFAHSDYGGGLRCRLVGAQFVRHADAFGGGGPASGDGFTPEEDESVESLM